jgi:hypothetical protein
MRTIRVNAYLEVCEFALVSALIHLSALFFFYDSRCSEKERVPFCSSEKLGIEKPSGFISSVLLSD